MILESALRGNEIVQNIENKLTLLPHALIGLLRLPKEAPYIKADPIEFTPNLPAYMPAPHIEIIEKQVSNYHSVSFSADQNGTPLTTIGSEVNKMWIPLKEDM